MKKLLLSLGALSAVVAPVAAVVACSSDDSKDPVTPATPEATKDLFATDVTAYQALNLMAWTQGDKIVVNTLTDAEWVGPTEVKQPAKVGTFDTTTKDTTLTTLKALYADVKKVIQGQLDNVMTSNKTPINDTFEAISNIFNATSSKTALSAYKDAVTAINNALGDIFTNSKLAGHSMLEVTTKTGGFAAQGDAQLTGVDKQIFEVGLPLLLKIAKTIGAVQG